MRKTLVYAVGVFLISGSAAFAQQAQPDQWRIQGDRGETVHVLPPAASVKANHDSQPALAQPSNNVSYAAASYGSVPGHLDYHSGKVMAGAISFQAVFYNSQPANALRSTIEGFVGTFGKSADYNSTLAQYTGSNGSISGTLGLLPSFVGTSASPRSISDTGVQSYLTGLFNAGNLTPSNTVLYGVYLPSGTTSTQGHYRGCSNYCGYHSVYTYGSYQIKYAVFPYLNCTACSVSGTTVADMETVVTSHEIREAVTDPGDNGTDAYWENASGYEADDKCAWHNLYRTAAGYLVQPEFSNSAAANGGKGCVVAP
jgi:hypothetical protein